MVAWLISHYINGMMANLFLFWYIILPALVFHVLSLFSTIRAAINNFKNARIKLASHAAVLLLLSGIIMAGSDLFKPGRILTATNNDDHYYDTLILREDGTAEMYGTSLIGTTDTYYGNFRIKGNLIIFTKKPVEVDRYFPDVIYWDKKQNKLFTQQNSDGAFITKAGFMNYFDIR